MSRPCSILFCCLGISLLVAGLAMAADKKPRAAKKTPAAVPDDPKLPRVLLLGDSISLGYHNAVVALLKGKANVHRPAQNCESTVTGLKRIDAWLGQEKWDVIHFNFGLHDLKYIDEKGKAVSIARGKQWVPVDEYERNLGQLVARLKKTGARLIWCTTTPVPPGTEIRVAGEEAKYNAAAARVIQAEGVAVDDLCAFAQPQLAKIQLPKNVHFSPAGSKELAKQVAASIEKALK